MTILSKVIKILPTNDVWLAIILKPYMSKVGCMS